MRNGSFLPMDPSPNISARVGIGWPRPPIVKRYCIILVDITKLDRKTELKPVDEQADDEIVHLDRPGKANGFPHQPFDPRAQREMFPLQLLCPPLADDMKFRIQVSVIGTPAIGVEAANAQRCEQRFQC